MVPIKIVGEWRRGGELEPGLYLRKPDPTHDSVGCFRIGNGGLPDHEYLGPIEIVEPEPDPTPLPGCKCDVLQIGIRWIAASACQTSHNNELAAFGSTRRQAILRHNAAVAAIDALESKQ